MERHRKRGKSPASPMRLTALPGLAGMRTRLSQALAAAAAVPTSRPETEPPVRISQKMKKITKCLSIAMPMSQQQV